MIRNNTDSIVKSTQSLYFQHKTISVEVCTVEQKLSYFCRFEVILK